MAAKRCIKVMEPAVEDAKSTRKATADPSGSPLPRTFEFAPGAIAGRRSCDRVWPLFGFLLTLISVHPVQQPMRKLFYVKKSFLFSLRCHCDQYSARYTLDSIQKYKEK